MRFESFVAARYLRGKRRNQFISLITFISVAGVSVGVMTLIIVMGVMTGFDRALTATIIGNRSHLTITPRFNQQMHDHPAIIDTLKAAHPEIVEAGPIIQIQGLLKRKNDTEGAYIVGVDPNREADITDLAANLGDSGGRQFGRGELPRDKEIVLGYILAQRLGATVGEEISVMTHKPTVTPFGMRQGSQVYLRVSGISQARMSEFDMVYAFVNIRTAQMLTGREGVDGIHMKLRDAMSAERVAKRIEEQNPNLRGTTWYESQAAFFGALEQEKIAMFTILVFIVLVAAFNITSTLIMIVMEKRRDIGILRTLGVSTGAIMRLFMLQGLIIGLGGTFFGVVLGTILAYNLNPVAETLAWIMGVDLFNSTIYYFDRIPVVVVPGDVFWITVSAVILSFLSTIYPAWSAARVHPVDALRYE